jgi:hypothetical protein
MTDRGFIWPHMNLQDMLPDPDPELCVGADASAHALFEELKPHLTDKSWPTDAYCAQRGWIRLPHLEDVWLDMFQGYGPVVDILKRAGVAELLAAWLPTTLRPLRPSFQHFRVFSCAVSEGGLGTASRLGFVRNLIFDREVRFMITIEPPDLMVFAATQGLVEALIGQTRAEQIEKMKSFYQRRWLGIGPPMEEFFPIYYPTLETGESQ